MWSHISDESPVHARVSAQSVQFATVNGMCAIRDIREASISAVVLTFLLVAGATWSVSPSRATALGASANRGLASLQALSARLVAGAICEHGARHPPSNLHA